MGNRAGSPPDTWGPRIVAALTDSAPLTMPQLRDRVGGPARGGALPPRLNAMIGKGQVIKIGDTARQHTYTLSPTWLPPRRKNARPPKEAGDEQLKRRPYSQRRTDDGVPLRVRILAAFAPGENLTTRELADRLDSPVTSVGAQISEMIRAGLLHVAQPATPGVERWDRYTPGPLPPPPEPWDQPTTGQRSKHWPPVRVT